jgi:hypothetical protein
VPAPIPVVYAQTTSNANSATYVVSVANTTVNRAILCVIAGSSGASNSTGVTDTQGNIYALSTQSLVNENVQFWYALNAVPLVAGTDTFTVTWATANTQQKNIIGFYVTGGKFGDIGASNNGSSTTASVSGTPVLPNQMIMVVVQGANGTQPIGTPAGYNFLASEQQAGQQITNVYYAWLPVPSAQSLTASLSASNQWAMLLAGTQVTNVSAVPSVPSYAAGLGAQQSDMTALLTDEMAFFQQRVVFRASQTSAATSLPNSGAATVIAFDTVLEDPYGGWNPSTHAWTPPAGYSGFYETTLTVWIVASGTTGTVNMIPSVSATTGTPLAETYVASNAPSGSATIFTQYLTGGQDSVQGFAQLFGAPGAVNTSLTNGQNSTLEIMWVSS